MNLTLTGIGRRERRTADAGVSLVELLVATVIAAVTLCGAWAWLWNVGVVELRDGGPHACGDCGGVRRPLHLRRSRRGDRTAGSAVRVWAGPALDLTHLHPGAAPEGVLIVWDPSRRVLWRKASGTYLADHVTRFAVTYYDGGGAALTPVDLEASAWPSRVVRVAVEVVVAAGSETAQAKCDVTLGQR